MRIVQKIVEAIPMQVPLLLLIHSLSTVDAGAQGQFLATNGSAPTHLGSIDGPLAGPGIWGQFLAGTTVDSLMPIGVPLEHTAGLIGIPGTGIVPGLPCGAIAQIQVVAWDSTVWGTSLDGVPASQLGRTDIVPVYLSCPPLPRGGPVFTQPAIVPPVPEPSFWTLIVLGGLWVWRQKSGAKAP